MEFESGGVVLSDLSRDLVGWHRVLDDQVSDEVQEDESSSSRTECHVVAGWFQLQASAHWTLDPVKLFVIEGDTSFTISNLFLTLCLGSSWPVDLGG